MKIHHIGYLVKNLDESREQFIKLGFETETGKEYDSGRDIFIQFLKNEAYRVELVQPAGETSPFMAAMKRFKNLPYHICYEAPDMDAAVSMYSEEGFVLSCPPEAAPCIGGRRVAFMQSREMGIIELLESEDK